MTVERGVRRIIVVVSVMTLLLGVAGDLMLARPHATVQVTLKDGRQFTLERHAGPLVIVLPVSVGSQLQSEYGILPGALSFEVAAAIADVRVLRGPTYRWSTASECTRVTVGLVLLLWAAFYVVRWVVHGFKQA